MHFKRELQIVALSVGILVHNKSIAHYTSQKAKYGGLYLYHKRLR